MEAIIGIKTLIIRFFFGTPKDKVNYNNIDLLKMEAQYFKRLYKNMLQENKSLKLKIRTYEIASAN